MSPKVDKGKGKGNGSGIMQRKGKGKKAPAPKIVKPDDGMNVDKTSDNKRRIFYLQKNISLFRLRSKSHRK